MNWLRMESLIQARYKYILRHKRLQNKFILINLCLNLDHDIFIRFKLTIPQNQLVLLQFYLPIIKV